jgi:hypothetical protein
LSPSGFLQRASPGRSSGKKAKSHSPGYLFSLFDELLRLLRGTKGKMMGPARNSNRVMANGWGLTQTKPTRSAIVTPLYEKENEKDRSIEYSRHLGSRLDSLLSEIQSLDRLAMIKFHWFLQAIAAVGAKRASCKLSTPRSSLLSPSLPPASGPLHRASPTR